MRWLAILVLLAGCDGREPSKPMPATDPVFTVILHRPTGDQTITGIETYDEWVFAHGINVRTNDGRSFSFRGDYDLSAK